MKKIVFSLAMIVAVGAAVVGATGAFFTDTETSTGNTFTAGALDLKVDSTCHYNGFVCEFTTNDNVQGYFWTDEDDVLGNEVPTPYVYGGVACACTWDADDLDGDPLFVYQDLKPGDWGENTISIHVEDNDAYGRVKFVGSANADNGIVDPEGDPALGNDTTDGDWCGELAQNMVVDIWLDEGSVAGFQNTGLTPNDAGYDAEEGDNILNGGETILDTTVILSETEAAAACAATAPVVETNWLDIGLISGGDTHYYGLGWKIPGTVGNEIQTDSIAFDVVFEIEQARHNDNPFQS